jgi:hypothetical protein
MRRGRPKSYPLARHTEGVRNPFLNVDVADSSAAEDLIDL